MNKSTKAPATPSKTYGMEKNQVSPRDKGVMHSKIKETGNIEKAQKFKGDYLTTKPAKKR